MQGLSDRPVVAVFGIGDHGGQGQTGRPLATHQRQRETPLLLKDDGHWNPRRGAAGLIARPCRGQIEQRADRWRDSTRTRRPVDRRASTVMRSDARILFSFRITAVRTCAPAKARIGALSPA
jgi:hypothetical protein